MSGTMDLEITSIKVFLEVMKVSLKLPKKMCSAGSKRKDRILRDNEI